MSVRILVAAVATTAALAVTPAAAAVVTYTFTGLADGYGGAGEKFGFAGQAFTDQAFTLTFRRDDATPGAVFSSSPSYSSITSSPGAVPVTATLLFNGWTIDFGFGAGTSGQTQKDGASEGFQLYSNDSAITQWAPGVNRFVGHTVNIRASGSGSNYLSSSDYHGLPALNPATTPLWVWSGVAEFSEVTYDSATGKVLTSKDNGKIYFRPQAMTTSAVPEPGSWALMIVGFGGAGAVLRRRRRYALA